MMDVRSSCPTRRAIIAGVALLCAGAPHALNAQSVADSSVFRRLELPAPNDIRTACRLVCMDLARERGADAVVMGGQSVSRTGGSIPGTDIEKAKMILQKYKRRV